MKKIFKQIHLWLSVPFGLVITLICFSGAMMVFENEVNELTQPHLYFVDPAGRKPIPVDRLLDKVAATLPDSVSVTGVTIPSEPGRTYQVSLSKPRRSSLYVDPYTGNITGKGERAAFFMFMFRLHRWLLDTMNPSGEGIFWGKLVVGVSALMFVVVLITGVVVWWPRTRRALKNSLKVCANKGWRRFWYDLHVAGGMYALIFLLAMALTGLTWSFPWYRTAFYKVFGVEAQERPMHGGEQKEHAREEGRPQRDGGRHDGRSARGDGQSGASRGEHGKGFGRGDGLHKESFGHGEHHSAFAHWQEVYDRLIRKNPDVKQIRLSDGKANVFVECFGNQRASDDYTFNPANGEITGVSLYRDRDKSDKMHGWIYAVHTGSWGGMLTRILAFIAALIGASLPLTGYYLWIKRLFRRRK